MSAFFDFIRRGFVLLMAIAALAGAAYVLRVDLEVRRVVALGDGIGGGGQLAPEAARKLIDANAGWKSLGTCRRDVLLAVGNLDSAAMEALVRDGDIPRVSRALDALKRDAKSILGCNPTEGMAWTWLAIGDDQSGASTEAVLADLMHSRSVTPNEQWVIAVRLPEATHIMSRRGETLAPVVGADLRTLITGGSDIYAAVDILVPVFDWLAPVARSEFVKLEGIGRRYEFARALGYYGKDIVGCSAKQFRNWQHHGFAGTCDRERDETQWF